jgi:hypothetical protein
MHIFERISEGNEEQNEEVEEVGQKEEELKDEEAQEAHMHIFERISEGNEDQSEKEEVQKIEDEEQSERDVIEEPQEAGDLDDASTEEDENEKRKRETFVFDLGPKSGDAEIGEESQGVLGLLDRLETIGQGYLLATQIGDRLELLCRAMQTEDEFNDADLVHLFEFNDFALVYFLMAVIVERPESSFKDTASHCLALIGSVYPSLWQDFLHSDEGNLFTIINVTLKALERCEAIAEETKERRAQTRRTIDESQYAGYDARDKVWLYFYIVINHSFNVE